MIISPVPRIYSVLPEIIDNSPTLNYSRRHYGNYNSLPYRTQNFQEETAILTNLILLPRSQAKGLSKGDPGIFRLNWYFMETDVGCVLGNAEFGLLVSFDGTESMQDQVISDLIGNAPGEVTPETYISRKLYLDSYATIPEPLGQRFREVKEGCTSFKEHP
jgi:hypothetical protein